MGPAGLGSGLQAESNSVSHGFTAGSLRQPQLQRKALLCMQSATQKPKGKCRWTSPLKLLLAICHPTGQNQSHDRDLAGGWGGEVGSAHRKGERVGV